ncbi:MAG: DUF4058 family protein [Gemmataceae bacterium]|nr:DUF4058 family protein [Gemmataceae bacterium]
MPIHDWTRVNAGTFHDFHSSGIIHLKETLNGGLLPRGYYALAEQHAGRVLTDILTLQVDEPITPDSGSVAVVEAPPKVTRKVVPSADATYRATRRTLAIRHVTTHRVVALIEILSPANKDRPASVEDFVEKALAALHHGCHLLVIDLFPPGLHDPQGIHGSIWGTFDAVDDFPPEDKPLTLAAYVGGRLPQAYLEAVAVGDSLPDMPLFLEPGRHILVPLETTYQAAYRGVPAYWRGVIEGSEPPA